MAQDSYFWIKPRLILSFNQCLRLTSPDYAFMRCRLYSTPKSHIIDGIIVSSLAANREYYPSVYIRCNCLFLLCHESLNYCPGNSFGYWLWLYNGLVFRFAANNTNSLIDLRDEDARTVLFRQKTLCYNNGNEAWFGALKHPLLRGFRNIMFGYWFS